MTSKLQAQLTHASLHALVDDALKARNAAAEVVVARADALDISIFGNEVDKLPEYKEFVRLSQQHEYLTGVAARFDSQFVSDEGKEKVA